MKIISIHKYNVYLEMYEKKQILCKLKQENQEKIDVLFLFLSFYNRVIIK